MKPITTIIGKAVPLDQANVDTDQIIPKQFLTAVTRKGFGKHLFHDWRYNDLNEQQPNPDFVLNKPRHQGSNILLTKANFGCGSSREHAPWSLTDYGFEAVIAPSFADIFYGNCMNNQLLPVALDEKDVALLFNRVEADPEIVIEIDLPAQQVRIEDHRFNFDIQPHHKYKLLNGLDAIGETLQQAASIDTYEAALPGWRE